MIFKIFVSPIKTLIDEQKTMIHYGCRVFIALKSDVIIVKFVK